ncbi:YxiF family protein [Paenibacillus apiarius]|uniref:YxiF family protein n=1 Tax=Paenibacillus apiarius TaxID=46240 RepID=UPI00197D0510|nr:hypothetical protein [Paenibacillus apiarius]MBN3522643.1 hypothetical protein [Paenibacillus apiarius]
MKDRKGKLQELLLQREIRAERSKLKELYLNYYRLNICDEQFMDFNESNELKRKGYEQVFKKDSIVCTEYREVLNWVGINYSQLKLLVDEQVVLFHMDNISGGILLSLELIFHNILGIDTVLPADLLVIDKDLEYGFCIEVEEHNYLITSWGLPCAE